MFINDVKFESKNEVVTPIVRLNGNFFLISVALDDTNIINKAVALAIKTKPKFGGKPGEPMKKLETSAMKNEKFRLWQDGVIVHSLKYIAVDEDVVKEVLDSETKEVIDTEEDVERRKYPFEWQTVDIDNPLTWENWREELRQKLTEVELQRLLGACMEANSLSERAINEAMTDFLSNPPVLVDLDSSLQEELGNTQSGEPAEESESVPQD